MKRDEDVGAWCLVLGRLVQRSLTLSRETGVKLSCDRRDLFLSGEACVDCRY